MPFGFVNLRAKVTLTADRRHYVQDRITPREDRLRDREPELIELDVPAVDVTSRLAACVVSLLSSDRGEGACCSGRRSPSWT